MDLSQLGIGHLTQDEASSSENNTIYPSNPAT